MYQSIAEEGPDEVKAVAFLKEATIQIHNRKIRTAYEFIMTGYDYSLGTASWDGTFKVGKGATTLELAAFFTRNLFFAKQLTSYELRKQFDEANVFFTEDAISKCNEYEANFAKAYAHLILHNHVNDCHKKLHGLEAIDKYLSVHPKCDKGHYLKAALLKKCYIPRLKRDFTREALASVEMALKLKKTPRSLFLKANILEDLVYDEDNPQVGDDGSLLVLHELCLLAPSSSIPFSNLHRYAHERRNIHLPNKSENKLIKLFNAHGTSFVNYLEEVIYKSRWANHKKGNEAASFRNEHASFLDVLSKNKFLFTYESYNESRMRKHKLNLSKSITTRQDNSLENLDAVDLESNQFYDDNLDMDQQSEEFWGSL